MQKRIFEILVLTALTVGLIWAILELTPKSALLSCTVKQTYVYHLGIYDLYYEVCCVSVTANTN